MTATTLDPTFSLKIAPPSVRGAKVSPAWLARLVNRMRNRRVVMVRAPGGYGKTTLLAQWRREALNARAYAGWLTLDDRDDRARFLQGLVACMRDATGNPQFGVAALSATQAPGGERTAMTVLLASMAEAARPITLVLDDAHLLPAATANDLLTYLLHNLPPNVQLALGTRQPLGLTLGELVARGECVEIGVEQLRLRVEESIDYLRARFGERFAVDDCARMHELADGWPIALQLLISTIEQDPTLDLAGIDDRSGNIERFFADALLSRLPPGEVDILVAASMLDAIHPDLIRQMTGLDGAATALEHLKATTPVLGFGEGSEWLRMHPLARRALAASLSAIPDERRRDLHWRAALWLHDSGDIEAAARHALAAERADTAYQWVGSGLHELAMTGRFGEVLGWADRLPADVLRRPDVALAIGWAQALSYQSRKAAQTLAILDAERDPRIRYEADVAQSVLAVYDDDLGRVATLLGGWGDGLTTASDQIRQIQVNVESYVVLERGDSARARYLQTRVPVADRPRSPGVASYYGEMIIGLSHLRDAQPRLADAVLRTALERSEAEGGRRGAAASILAAVRATALWAQDRRAEAESVLAYRLDVGERACPPEAMTLMYVTLARIAYAGGDEPRAVELLQRLQAIGEERRLPRLVLQSLREQIRLQAAGGRGGTAAQLEERLEACWQEGQQALAPSQAARFGLIGQIGRTYARLAARDIEAARVALAEAESLARRINHTRDLLECRVLSSLTAKAGDRDADAALREVLSIAEANGFLRLVADTLPEAAARVGLMGREGSTTHSIAAVATGAARDSRERREAASPPAGGRPSTAAKGAALALLTPTEAALLDHLARGMTNKEIARALDVGPETVKWHLKNVFAKLNAGSRRHAVDRARILGLL